ncbi:MAG: hypothetical protein A2Y15_04265 [Clostridiales bacterium GWF2_36_10]|nr:MAG: hypothetical protein A2Y15_04265 [Clostridiales bacterium GWF2_36_10]HAN20500.1 hypothetical protein [Clostridiales bacterium]
MHSHSYRSSVETLVSMIETSSAAIKYITKTTAHNLIPLIKYIFDLIKSNFNRHKNTIYIILILVYIIVGYYIIHKEFFFATIILD